MVIMKCAKTCVDCSILTLVTGILKLPIFGMFPNLTLIQTVTDQCSQVHDEAVLCGCLGGVLNLFGGIGSSSRSSNRSKIKSG